MRSRTCACGVAPPRAVHEGHGPALRRARLRLGRGRAARRVGPRREEERAASGRFGTPRRRAARRARRSGRVSNRARSGSITRKPSACLVARSTRPPNVDQLGAARGPTGTTSVQWSYRTTASDTGRRSSGTTSSCPSPRRVACRTLRPRSAGTVRAERRTSGPAGRLGTASRLVSSCALKTGSSYVRPEHSGPLILGCKPSSSVTRTPGRWSEAGGSPASSSVGRPEGRSCRRFPSRDDQQAPR